jgi:hypothetical protein
MGNARVLEQPFAAAMATASTGLPEPMSAESRFSDGNQLPSLAVRCSGERGRKQGV